MDLSDFATGLSLVKEARTVIYS